MKAIICFLTIFSLSTNFVYSDDCNFPGLDYDPRVINTNYGKIEGLCNKVNIADPDQPNRVEYALTWFSVPFAKPPVNELRFRKPVPPEPWTGTRDGTKKLFRCMQGVGSNSGTSIPVSEDCLHLNIFAPASLFNKTNYEKLPIYVYIHGGRFEGGSGHDQDLDSKVLVTLTNVIVVTINYRVGPFGFLYLAGSDLSGNQGFLDQHLALKWAYENADHFRGDRNRITIGGFSAGSFSASYHLIYKPGFQYFRNVIMESGVLLYSTMEFMPLQEANRRAKDIFALIGCGNDTLLALTPNQILKCSESVSATTFLTAANDYYKNTLLVGHTDAIELTPLIRLVQDGEEFTESIKESFENGHIKKANILIGFTQNEFGLAASQLGTNVNKDRMRAYFEKFFYYFPTYPTVVSSSFIDDVMNEYTKDVVNPNTANYLLNAISALSEEVFICPMLDLSRIYSKQNNVFTFQFEHVKASSGGGPSSSTSSLIGAVHGHQVPYVFAKTLDSVMANGYTVDERRFTKILIKYWTNFMKNNNPNINDVSDKNYNPYWPTFKTNLTLNIFGADTRYFNNYMTLKSSLIAPTSDLSHRHCDFWRKYNTYPNNY